MTTRRYLRCCSPILVAFPSGYAFAHSKFCPTRARLKVEDSEWIVADIREESPQEQDHQRAVVLDVCEYCGATGLPHYSSCMTNPYASPEVEDGRRRAMLALHPELVDEIPGYTPKEARFDG